MFAFRRDLMSCVGGVAWLLHVMRLGLPLGVGDFGCPDALRADMAKRGW